MSALEDALDFAEDNNTIGSGVSVSAARIELAAIRAIIKEQEQEIENIKRREAVVVGNYQNSISKLETAITQAREQLRATQENWREDCLFRADEILTAVLEVEPDSLIHPPAANRLPIHPSKPS
jgi:hypothetical protein